MSNPIVPGFEWSQAFDLPSDFLQTGDGLRAEFRKFADDNKKLAEISSPSGLVINGNRVFFYLTELQTLNMAPFEVVTNLVLLRDDKELPIGVIIHIPVMIFPTRAT